MEIEKRLGFHKGCMIIADWREENNVWQVTLCDGQAPMSTGYNNDIDKAKEEAIKRYDEFFK